MKLIHLLYFLLFLSCEVPTTKYPYEEFNQRFIFDSTRLQEIVHDKDNQWTGANRYYPDSSPHEILNQIDSNKYAFECYYRSGKLRSEGEVIHDTTRLDSTFWYSIDLETYGSIIDTIVNQSSVYLFNTTLFDPEGRKRNKFSSIWFDITFDDKYTFINDTIRWWTQYKYEFVDSNQVRIYNKLGDLRKKRIELDSNITSYEFYDFNGKKYCEGYTLDTMLWDTTYFNDPLDTINFGKFKYAGGSKDEIFHGKWKYYKNEKTERIIDYSGKVIKFKRQSLFSYQN